jgi:uncharacterized repeat protein (TIGR03803 family)
MIARSRRRILRSSVRSVVVGTMIALGHAGVAHAQFTVLHNFSATVDGESPWGLVQASDGNFYGTTQFGGTTNQGMAFVMTPAGTVTVLHNFSSATDGATPFSGLIQGTDGNFYGTTFRGGTAGAGIAFVMTPAGDVTVLHSFTGFTTTDGASPAAGLIQATDGNFYGTTYSGGDSGVGTVFQMTPAGSVSVLHSFTGADGSRPYAALIQGFDGQLYGMTSDGGASNFGTVFAISLTGTFNPLHPFSGGAGDGATPYAALVQAIDGNLYGMTFAGGVSGLGTVFKITTGGTLTLLHSFSGGAGDGANPYAALMQTSDLSFYGTTERGGSANAGTIFTMTFSGTTTIVHTFTGSDGANPAGTFIHANDGNFYGTTGAGGAFPGHGVAFRLLNPAPCDDTLKLSYAAGALNIGFTLQSATASTWSTWLITTTTSINLWSIPIPILSPAVSLTLPLSGFPQIGNVSVLTALTPSTGPICVDLKSVNTGP